MKMVGGGMTLPTGGSLFSLYASLSATFTLLQQAFYQFVPLAVQEYLYALIRRWFTRTPSPLPDLVTLLIEPTDGFNRNEIFNACQIYLCYKMSDSANLFKVSRAPNEEIMSFKLAKGVAFEDTFEGIHLKWSFLYSAASTPPPTVHHGGYMNPANPPNRQNQCSEKTQFSLTFDKKHKNKVTNSYLPFVVETSKEIIRKESVLKLWDCISNANYHSYPGSSNMKNSVNMTHPFTFDKLAIDPEMKKAIMEDLDRFVRRKEFYRRVGKPWKRGYLLYGPPGTGKSSLVAAMANYLKFDIYDLQLSRISDDSSLRNLLLTVPNRSILVIEDIDCSVEIPATWKMTDMSQYQGYDYQGYGDIDYGNGYNKARSQMSLAALLNFVDGLWSCCGDERLIVFTTNHKEKLDPALLRPGRMDMHIHMSYLTMAGFKVLAHNYLLVSDTSSSNHEHASLFGEIQSLLESVNATPAEVAEELMRSEEVDIALKGVIELLKRKKSEKAAAANRRDEESSLSLYL